MSKEKSIEQTVNLPLLVLCNFPTWSEPIYIDIEVIVSSFFFFFFNISPVLWIVTAFQNMNPFK